MWVDEELLAPVRASYGTPEMLQLQLEISEEERDLVLHSTRKGRHHDVTFFVLNDERLALIRKPALRARAVAATGRWAQARRAARDGSEARGVRRARRGDRADAVPGTHEGGLHHGNVTIPWETHVFAASTEAVKSTPSIHIEISAARWGTLGELSGPIRKRLLASGRALWRYRVALHDAAGGALSS